MGHAIGGIGTVLGPVRRRQHQDGDIRLRLQRMREELVSPLADGGHGLPVLLAAAAHMHRKDVAGQRSEIRVLLGHTTGSLCER
jgi:hypothetical protein